MDAVILFAIAVVIVNLAFVVIPAHELRDLFLPPRNTPTLPPGETRPAGPVEQAAPLAIRQVSWRADRATVAPSARGERRATQTIMLRSTLPEGVSSAVTQVAAGA